jgi:NTE family protein
MNLPRVSLILFSFLLSAHCIHAQEAVNRPSLGLALSGGGALGIAHLGVLRVMEESGLKPDCISGVSMGSVVGGLYSIGYSIYSILNIFKYNDLEGAITNRIPEDKIIFLEKRNIQNSIISLPASFRKVILPSGLSNGQVIENFISYYAWPAADITDFSKLPIPYTCVGSDILTARFVDLKTGYLADAVRASLAIPSVFTPIKIDTALLLDGGIYRNYPAQEVLDLGADIVIGSYTGFHWKGENELESVSDILKQISFSITYNDFEQQKKLTDYLIEPDLKGLLSMDFSRVDSIYQRGYRAALPFREKFIRLADSLNSLEPRKPSGYIMNKEYYTFDNIEITGNSNYSDRQIMGVLDIKKGEQVDKYMMKERMDLLFGRNWFEKVKYRVEPRNDSLILVIECIEKPIAMLYGSVHYDYTLGSGALLSFASKNFLLPGSLLTIDTSIGKYPRVIALLLKYLGWKHVYSVSTDFSYDNTPVPVLHLKNESGDVLSGNLTAGVNLARSLGLNHMFRISGIYENLNLMPRYLSSTGLDNITYNYFRAEANYGINTLDKKYFPDRGTIMEISVSTSKLISASLKTDAEKATFYSSDPGMFVFERFYTLNGGFRQYFSSGKYVTLAIHADALYLSSCDSAMSQNNFYMLGGIQTVNERSIAMTGFHSSEIPVKKAAGVGFEIDIEAFNNFHITLTTDVFAVQDIYNSKGYNLLAGFGAGAGYMTLAGPIKIGIMYGENPFDNYFNSLKGYISLGFNF